MRHYLLAVLLLVPTFGWAAGDFSATAFSESCAELGSYENATDQSVGAWSYTTFVAWEAENTNSTGAPVIVADPVAGSIRLGTQGAGKYLVMVDVSFDLSTEAGEIHCDVHRNGTDLSIGFRESVGASTQFGTGAGVGLVTLAAGDALALECEAVDAETITDSSASVVLMRIGP